MLIDRTYRMLFLPVLILLASVCSVNGQVDFPAGSSFRYLKGKDAATLGGVWMAPGYNDSWWSTGNAPLRYGDGSGGTDLTDMQYQYSVVYMRSTFQAAEVDSLDALTLTIDYDDGFVIWINGTLVLHRNAPLSISYNSFATQNHESGVAEMFRLDPEEVPLQEGENTIAVQGFNVSLESSDFLFDIAMHADLLVPTLLDTVGLYFSAPAGFYSDPFYLDILPADPSWDVRYTLDGSNPQDSETAFSANGKATVHIDPDDPEGRPLSPAVILRASAVAGGIRPALPETRTFVFPDRVLEQEYPGGGWPDQPVNEQLIDLGMDPEIVNHAAYQDQMIPALTDLPSISLVTDLDNLFDPVSGIYVNAAGHGFSWERECSVELIHPDGTDGFNVNAGLRIRGGWSRHPDFPEHGFRLFFRSEYGDPKLYFPLFGEEGVDRFDKIDLRCAQNYSWANGDPRNTFLRDVFSRDTQRDLGQPYTRSRYYHLYLNGMYWGLFQSQERAEARFAADYFGGKTEEYDVIKVNTEDWVYRIEATDGNFDSWYTLYNMCNTGFSSNADYFRLEGKNADGEPVTGGRIYVDIDNLIDYMLTIFYTGNFDSPTASFMGNKWPNNFFAINSRVDRSRGFTFFTHDNEHSLFAEVINPGLGLYEDRVNLTERPEGMRMDVYDFSAFHPQWLHYKLTANEEYRMRFRDHAFLHLTGNGALTPGQNEQRLNQRAAEIDLAIIAESARWGDSKRGDAYPYTRDDNWIHQVQRIRSAFFPYRTQIVVDQLREAGLFSDIDPPRVFVNGEITMQHSFTASAPTTLVLENINHEGVLCYTTDGSDPRMVGGAIAEKARISLDDRVTLEFGGSAVIRARIRIGETWSAMQTCDLHALDEDYSNLCITELNYHPEDLWFEGDTLSGKDLEFIELKNRGSEAVSLRGVVLDSAVYYEFPEDALLAPGQFYVVASEPSDFYLRYGLLASGRFTKNFSNGGERVLLSDSQGNSLIDFSYSDEGAWPLAADGGGYSLVSQEINPDGDPAGAGYWKASSEIGGSPFRNDPGSSGEVPSVPASREMFVYPNPTSGVLHVILPEGADQSKSDVKLYGSRGELLLQLDHLPSGVIHLEGLNLGSGIYILQVYTGDHLYRRKIIYSRGQ